MAVNVKNMNIYIVIVALKFNEVVLTNILSVIHCHYTAFKFTINLCLRHMSPECDI